MDRAPSGAPGQASRTWLQVLTNWRGRINRMQFLAGNALLLTGICLAFGVILLVSSVVGGRALDLATPLSFIVIFASLVPVSALVAQRLHDLGRSAFGPLLALGLAVASQGVAAAAFFDVVHGLFGGWLASSLYDLGLSQAMFWAPFACTVAAMLVMGPLFARGQEGANRFGPPPSGNDIRLA
jgi:uncharacterized membrane protein YhaH (DUF805 family)